MYTVSGYIHYKLFSFDELKSKLATESENEGRIRKIDQLL